MEIAISPTTPGLSAAEQTDLCRSAEASGIRKAWLAEVAGPEAFALCGAIASNTSSLEVGVAVVAAGNRTPALLAMGAATVSQLSQGRPFTLGIGSSSDVMMEKWHGRSFGEPLARVRQTVEATRAALAGERDYAGKHAPMSAFRLEELPAGAVSLYVAALGPRMLRLAGAVGDGVCLNMMPPHAVPRQLAEVAVGAEQAGRELPADFGVMARIHWVPGDAAAGREVVRRAFGAYFAQPVYNRFLAWCGYPEAAAAIADAFADGDRDRVGAAFSDEIIDGIAVLGSPDDARRRLDEFGDAGIEVAAVNILAPDAAAVTAAMTALVP
jgi:probable F420-dependent oxidoreductase